MDGFVKGFSVIALSFLVIGGYLYLSYVVVTGHVDATDPQKLLLIGSAYGSLVTIAGLVVQYHFGSTKSSADKDRTISSMAANIPVAPSTQTITSTKTVEPSTPSS